jgi:hypothetical protein
VIGSDYGEIVEREMFSNIECLPHQSTVVTFCITYFNIKKLILPTQRMSMFRMILKRHKPQFLNVEVGGTTFLQRPSEALVLAKGKVGSALSETRCN